MPIVIPRNEGVSVIQQELSQEQSNKLWEQIVKNWAQAHPEALKNQVEVNK